MFHGEISKWLLHEDQKWLFEIVFGITLNVVFLVLIALLLWALGMPAMAFGLTKGYAILWLVILVTYFLLSRIHRLFRVNIYDHFDTYVISNLAMSCLLQAGWSAFAALTVASFVPGATVWVKVALYVVGVLSCLIAFYAVSSFYQGHIYKMVSLPLALICFIVFSLWPGSGRVVYGWFFDLF